MILLLKTIYHKCQPIEFRKKSFLFGTGFGASNSSPIKKERGKAGIFSIFAACSISNNYSVKPMTGAIFFS